MVPPLHRRLSPDSWDALFDFLDPARVEKRGLHRDDDAESRFQEITRKLAYFFAGRGCRDAEDLAAETVMRVAGKCAEVPAAGFAERISYFYGVARNVLHEWQRESARESTKLESAGKDPTFIAAADAHLRTQEDEQQRCLDVCMASLSREARKLILNYYGPERAAKIAAHRQLAGQLGKSLNALRIEVHRVRNTLRTCVFECMHPRTVSMRGAQ